MTFASLDWYLGVAETITALYREELHREPEPAGLFNWIYHAREEGWTAEQMRAAIRTSPEWHEIHDRPARPSPKQRAPLTLPDGPLDRVLPWNPPQTRDYLRADAWGVTLPGLPFVPGASSKHPERCLSWFLDRWSLDWQRRILDAHAERGYTHFILSWPDSRGIGQSLDQFADTVRRVLNTGFYPHIKLASKVYDPRDMSPEYWAGRLESVFAALGSFAAEYGVWEWDLWNMPGNPTLRTFKWMGQQAHAMGASFWAHFSPHRTSWFADGEPRGRFGFWDDLGADVDGLDYQTDPRWSIAETQARLVDTLWHFGSEGNRHKLRFFEDQAALMFDQDRPNEDDANLRGYLACCTIDNVRHTDARVFGYGNGARRPDGTVL